jgi:toxic protein SymE
MPNKERKLKIVPRYFPRVWEDAVFPEIRLAGKWLQDLGFKCGNFVVITQSESAITITALPEVKAEPQPVTKNTRKAKPIFSPQLDAMPGNQLFTVLPAEVYNEDVADTNFQTPPSQVAEGI